MISQYGSGDGDHQERGWVPVGGAVSWGAGQCETAVRLGSTCRCTKLRAGRIKPDKRKLRLTAAIHAYSGAPDNRALLLPRCTPSSFMWWSCKWKGNRTKREGSQNVGLHRIFGTRTFPEWWMPCGQQIWSRVFQPKSVSYGSLLHLPEGRGCWGDGSREH